MARELVEYILNLGGDLADEAKRARGELNSLSGAATVGLRAAGGLATAALAAGTAFGKLANDIFSVVDRVGDLAAGAGLSTDVVNGLRLAAAATSGELEGLVPQKLAAKMLDAASGSQQASAAFQTLGVQITDTQGRLRDADGVFREALESVLAIPDPATRAAMSMEVFGEQGKALLGAFQDIESFDRLIAGAREFGIDTGPAAAEAAGKWFQATSNLKLAFEDASQSLLDRLGPTATWFIESFALGFVYLTSFAAGVFDQLGTFVSDWIDLVAEQFGRIGSLLSGQLSLSQFFADSTAAAEGFGAKLEDIVTTSMEAAIGRAAAFWATFQQSGGIPAPSGAGGGAAIVPGGGAPTEGLSEFEIGLHAMSANLAVAAPQIERLGAAAIDHVDGIGKFAIELADASTAVATEVPQILANLKQIREDAIGAVAGDVMAGLQGGIGTAIGIAVGGPLGAAVGTMVDSIRAGEIDDQILGLVGGLQQLVNQIPAMVGTIISDVIPTILGQLPQLLGDLATIGPQVFMAIVDALPELVGALIQAVPAIAAGIVKAMVEALATLFSPEFWLNVAKSMAAAIGEAIKNILSIFKDKEGHFLGTNFKGDDKELFGIKLPKFAEGTPFVNQTGLAVVHRGEAIIPAGQNRSRGSVSISIGTVVTPNPREFVRILNRELGSHGLGLSLGALVT